MPQKKNAPRPYYPVPKGNVMVIGDGQFHTDQIADGRLSTLFSPFSYSAQQNNSPDACLQLGPELTFALLRDFNSYRCCYHTTHKDILASV